MMRIPAMQQAMIERIALNEPVTFEQLDLDTPMRSCVLSSLLKRLQIKGLVGYASGEYTVTEEGRMYL